MTKRRQIVLGVLLSLVSLLVILRGISWDELGWAMSQATYWWVLPFVVLETLSLWARAMRWRALLENRIGGARLFWLTNISYYLSNVMPLRIGEVARVYLASRDSDVGGMQAFSSVVVDRMFDLVTVMALLLAVLPFVPHDGSIHNIAYWVVIGVISVVVCGIMLTRKRDEVGTFIGRSIGALVPRLGSKISQSVNGFLTNLAMIRVRDLVIAALWSGLVWLLAVLASYCMLLAFQPSQPLYVAAFTTTAIAIGIALPSVPAGLGLWEASTVAALSLFNIDRESALAYAVTMHLVIFVEMALLGMYGLHIEGENVNHLAETAKTFMRKLRNQRVTVA